MQSTGVYWIVFSLLGTAVAGAQPVHPCDTAPITFGTVTTVMTPVVIFCAQEIEKIQGAFVYIVPDGASAAYKEAVGGLTALTEPSAAGAIQYSGIIAKLGQGTYVITASVYNLDESGRVQEGPASAVPFCLSVVEPEELPATPIRVNVVQRATRAHRPGGGGRHPPNSRRKSQRRSSGPAVRPRHLP